MAACVLDGTGQKGVKEGRTRADDAHIVRARYW